MSDYSAKVAALEAALASGELSIESDGDKVTYRSIKDLRSSLDYFRGLQVSPARPSTTLACFDPR